MAMAGSDPRRSSRARTTPSNTQASSTSSSVSGRFERNTRSFKTGSPQKSTPTASLASEPLDDLADDALPARRRTRGQDAECDRASSKDDLAGPDQVNDLVHEDDEVVRCICGFEDFQGPPPMEYGAKHGHKDPIDLDPIFTTEFNEETAGFFVQCDICKVWQHGVCVGIMTEESSPEEYFCEECRKELHKIFTASNGQRYSHYLPSKRHHSRTASRATSQTKDGTRSPKERETTRIPAAQQTSMRRSTMNSRGAYDEAEALRRAIEESKEEARYEHVETNSRLEKRSRSNDSGEMQEEVKRQRTSSRSPSPIHDYDNASDTVGATTRGTSKPKSRSTAATRNGRSEKDSAQKDEREWQRTESANKRKGRADRRQVDETIEEAPLGARTSISRVNGENTVTTTQEGSHPPPPDKSTTSDAAFPPPPPSSIPPHSSQGPPEISGSNAGAAKAENKKPARSHKKKGRNQYTKDRDNASPSRSQSRDPHKDEGGTAKGEGSHHNSRSHAKGKGGFYHKNSMADMRRRAAALLDFISRTQLELAGESPSAVKATAFQPASATAANGSKPSSLTLASANLSGAGATTATAASGERAFESLGCMEMMDSLTRRLVKWQQEYTT